MTVDDIKPGVWFGNLRVRRYDEGQEQPTQSKYRVVICDCSCGNTSFRTVSQLIYSKVTGCSDCMKANMWSAKRREDQAFRIGQRNRRWIGLA
jgi:hypothetical protein